MVRTRDILVNYSRVIYALVLHDMKSRFLGNGLGQIVAVLWPFVHIIILLFLFSRGRAIPFGDSSILYIATGVLPFITFSYMSRFVMYSAVTNKSFLCYPIIKPLDIMIARSVIESLSIFIITILMILLCIAMNIDPWPVDVKEAAYAWLAALFLSFGLGILNGAIAEMVPMWLTGYSLFIILFYMGSGILFVPSYIPQPFRDYLALNPVLQTVEWMRMAYYNNYPSDVLNKTYLLCFALVVTAAGLLLERVVRRFNTV